MCSSDLVFAMGRDLDFGLRLVLRADEVPEARLGAGRLGQTLWLDPVAGRDGDELCFGSLTERTGAAAALVLYLVTTTLNGNSCKI